MSNVETKAIVPYREEPIKSFSMQDLNFYLSHVLLLPDSELPPHIDLSPYEELMNHLYDNAKPSYVYSNEDRRRIADSEGKSDLQKELKEKLQAAFEVQEDGERHTLIYQDRADGSIKFTPLEHGDFTSVKSSAFYEVVSMDNIPLLGVHTHPNNSLFSPQDYAIMLLSSGQKEGELKGQLLLLPDCQILALATDQTPVLEPEQVTEFVNTKKENIDKSVSGQRATALLSRAQKIAEAQGEFLVRNTESAMASVSRLDERLNKGDISREEAERLAQEEKERATERLQNYISKSQRVLGKITTIHQDLTDKTINQHLLDLARTINVKLYISFNRKDFRAFSA